MTLRLVAAKEPYASFRTMGDPTGSLVFLSRDPPIDAPPPDILVLPAEDFLELPGDRRAGSCVLAYGSVDRMAACFEAGCADYLREPWTRAELLARSRRFETIRCRLSSATLELVGNRLAAGDRETRLTEGERRILRLLMLNAERLVPRSALAFALWGEDRPRSRVPDMHIASLRRRLSRLLPEAVDAIESCRGRGYRFLARSCG